ncbi:hypothetical protein [Catenulispora pinistramenti]|uniref:hypothetical protein n=1 Tax=Catenulispora pinistramenti TaxID=2705254 RepID=UPI001BA6F694|nr:hypothetical protein [Catenulispora pinistramenti]
MTDAQRMLAISTVRTPHRADLSTLTILRLSEPVSLRHVTQAIAVFANDSLYARYHVRRSERSELLQSFAERTAKTVADWYVADPDVPLSTSHPTVDEVMKCPWDLDARPLIRFVLRVRDGAVLEIAVVLHHLLGDGASHLRIMRNVGSWLVGDGRDLDVDRYLAAVEQTLAAERLARSKDQDYWTDRIEAWKPGRADPLKEAFPESDAETGGVRARALLPLAQVSGVPRAPRIGELVHDVYRALAAQRISGILVWIAASTRSRGADTEPDFGYFVSMLPMLPSDPEAVAGDPLWADDIRRRFLSPEDIRQTLWDADAQWGELYLTYRKSVAQNSVHPIGSGSATFDLLQPYHAPLGHGSIRYAQIGAELDLQVDGDVGSSIFPQLVARFEQ